MSKNKKAVKVSNNINNLKKKKEPTRRNSSKGAIRNGSPKKRPQGKLPWRPIIGNKARSSKELLQEISIIAKTDKSFSEINDSDIIGQM